MIMRAAGRKITGRRGVRVPAIHVLLRMRVRRRGHRVIMPMRCCPVGMSRGASRREGKAGCKEENQKPAALHAIGNIDAGRTEN